MRTAEYFREVTERTRQRVEKQTKILAQKVETEERSKLPQIENILDRIETAASLGRNSFSVFFERTSVISDTEQEKNHRMIRASVWREWAIENLEPLNFNVHVRHENLLLAVDVEW